MMSKVPMWRRYLRFFGSDIDDDIDEELHFHIAAKTDDLVARGWTQEAAKSAALREFGEIGSVHATCFKLHRRSEQHMQLADYFSGLRQDSAFGLKQLVRHWLPTVLAIVTLGIGIGAVTAVFSILYAVVLHPLPFPHPDRIVSIWSYRNGHNDIATPRNFDSWRRDSKSIEQMAALQRNAFTLSGDGRPVEVTGGEVTSDFFSVFGVSPEFGRTFTTEETMPPRQHLVILSHRLWIERFNANRAILGTQVDLDREPYTIIGVMPKSFDLRQDGEQLWVPLPLSWQEMNWAGGTLYVFGRLRPNVEINQVQAEMNVEAQVLQHRFPEMNQGRDIRVEPFAASLVGDYSKELWILLMAVNSVFLIACANVANLLLAQTTGRSRELTLRAALGASRVRIVRQLLIEHSLLGLISGIVGLGVALAAVRGIRLLSISSMPRIDEVSINLPVLLTLLGLSIACTLLSGMLPAFRAARLNPQAALIQGERSTGGLARDKSRSIYIVIQVGLALVLLVGAGMVIRTAIAAQQVQPGFDPDSVMTGRTSLPPAAYSTADQIISAYQRVLDQLAAEPGIRAAALSSKVPLGLSTMGIAFKANSVTPPLKQDQSAELQYVSPNYFSTMKIALRSGRDFNVHDRAGSRKVVIVNEKLAQLLWPGRDPMGQQLRLPDLDDTSPVREVIGVVSSIRDNGVLADPPAILYLPIAQVPINPWHWAQQSLYLVARTQTESLAEPTLLRKALDRVDSGLPLGDALTMKQRLAHSTSAAQLYTFLLSGLGLCGLILTGAGIYGVVAYFVARQRVEIGIRIALGASRTQVLIFVLRQGMLPVFVGALVGLLGSWVISRVLTSRLYAADRMDPITSSIVLLVMLGIALLACYIPARHAARVDPMITLRGQ
jgi:putative ABC transport system permease protein